MNSLDNIVIKLGRRVYDSLNGSPRKKIKSNDFAPNGILQMEEGNHLIADMLCKDKPFMVTRFGQVELSVLVDFLEMNELKMQYSMQVVLSRIKGKVNYWTPRNIVEIEKNAGFFPVNNQTLTQFSDTYIKCSKLIDVLGVWYNYGEHIMHQQFFPNAKLIPLQSIEPYYFQSPWSRYLYNKKVLVIHPFEKSIQYQYQRRKMLFENEQVLPDFDLKTIKVVQSNAFNNVNYTSWFEALQSMIEKIDKTDFDVALIGAGAYGLPLAAHVKKIGKQAIHFGGSLQVLFGIKGKRWDNMPDVNRFYNEHWIRPLQEETPNDFKSVENGCYW
jgi:hypothetical protein